MKPLDQITGLKFLKVKVENLLNFNLMNYDFIVDADDLYLLINFFIKENRRFQYNLFQVISELINFFTNYIKF